MTVATRPQIRVKQHGLRYSEGTYLDNAIRRAVVRHWCRLHCRPFKIELSNEDGSVYAVILDEEIVMVGNMLGETLEVATKRYSRLAGLSVEAARARVWSRVRQLIAHNESGKGDSISPC